jgi:putative tryptophan/tyrosine transport system substrate-binding protein
MPRIGYLGGPPIPPYQEAFRQGLREHGYVEGQNIVIEWRFTEGSPEVLADAAAELVHQPVRVIVAQSTPAALAASRASSTTPIVMSVGDPVAAGLAASLARPGGNVTGLSNFSPQLAAKRLEWLREAIPSLARVGVAWTPYNPLKAMQWLETESAAQTLSVQLQSLEVGGPEDFESAFAAAVQDRAHALVVFGDNVTASHAPQIVELAAKYRLPTMYEARTFVDAGGLMSYGPNVPGSYRRAAYYVDRILKGAKPADLPVEQPREFEFVINAKTAQALGLTIPQHVLLQATEVIQ